MNATAATTALAAPAVTDTYGLPACDTRLIAKLRAMDPQLRATLPVLTKETK